MVGLGTLVYANGMAAWIFIGYVECGGERREGEKAVRSGRGYVGVEEVEMGEEKGEW